MKSSLVLISIGILNILHGLTHLLQFIQSLLLATLPFTENGIHEIVESPIMSLVWCLIGFLSLYTGWKDRKHHRGCSK